MPKPLPITLEVRVTGSVDGSLFDQTEVTFTIIARKPGLVARCAPRLGERLAWGDAFSAEMRAALPGIDRVSDVVHELTDGTRLPTVTVVAEADHGVSDSLMQSLVAEGFTRITVDEVRTRP